MKNKVMKFSDQLPSNEDANYSKLFNQFIEPFLEEFSSMTAEETVSFAVNAWNIANLKVLVSREDVDRAIKAINTTDDGKDLLKRMTDAKADRFHLYTDFILDVEHSRGLNLKLLISRVLTQEQDAFLASFEQSVAETPSVEAFDENFIDRVAIILKPLQPFKDWVAGLGDFETMEDLTMCNTYLLNEELDPEVWLKKNYDRIFAMELEAWHANKTRWPQKRNYKKFKQWFQVEISELVYDLELYPVSKSL